MEPGRVDIASKGGRNGMISLKTAAQSVRRIWAHGGFRPLCAAPVTPAANLALRSGSRIIQAAPFAASPLRAQLP